MIARTTKTICELLAASLLGMMLLGTIAGWHLARGPVALDFLTPYLVSALNGHGSPFRVTIDKTNLAWAGWRRNLDIRVLGVRAVAEDGRVVANVSEMSVGISIRGLLRGIVAPTGIDVIGAALRLQRAESGEFSLALDDSGGSGGNANPEVINRLIQAVQSERDPDRPVTYLRRIRILNAKLEIDDRFTGLTWGAAQADVVLLKEGSELRGDYFVKLDIGVENTTLKGTASWHPDTEIIRIQTAFAGVKLDRLAKKIPQLKSLESMRLEVKGRASMTVSTKGFLRAAAFDVRAGDGVIAHGPLWPEGLPVASARLRGSFDGETGRLEIKRIDADLGGPKLSGNAFALRVGKGLKINSRLTIDKMALARLGKYWPEAIGARPRAWVTANMPLGEIVDAEVILGLNVDDVAGEKISLETLSGTLKFKDMSIYHLSGLPPVTNVAASAVFTRDRFIARIRHGKSNGLTVTSAEVRLTELLGNTEQAEIDVAVRGKLSDALVLIDRPPLRYATRFGLQPRSVSGGIDAKLKFSFPILNDLPLEKVDIRTTSRLSNPKVPNLAFGQTVSAGSLDLMVDTHGMVLSGKAKIGAVDAAIKWTELFSGEEKYPRRYEARTVLGKAQRDAVGLFDTSPYLEGPVAVDLAVSQPRAGPSEIAVKLSLKDAKLWLPGFRWRKPAGREGVAWLRMVVAADGTLSVPEFSIGSPGLAAKGSMEFDRNRKFAGIDIAKFTLGRTDLSARAGVKPDGGLDVDIRGKTLDAISFFEPDDDETSVDEARNAEAFPPTVDIRFNIDRVWFDDKIPVDRLTGDLQRREDDWRKVTLSGLVGDNQKVTLTYRANSDSQKVVVRSDNAGDALRALDTFDTIQGGTMILSADRKGRGAEIPWKGSLVISDFVLVKAPVIAKLLTIASLTGLGDTLAGRGIRFAKLEAPFAFADGIATIDNARTVGAELGFTADGTIDMNATTVRLTGTIVPAHTLNTVLGNIPVLGKILTGAKGRGIFAATYRVEGPLDQPTITVNPLAALAPGFLRNLIGIFDGSTRLDTSSEPVVQETD